MKIKLLLLLIFLAGCKSETYESILANKIENFFDNTSDYKYIVVIPGAGCSGCITRAENFFVKNINNEKIKFVFTNNFSKKNLYLKLKKENINRNNVFVDSDNQLYIADYDESIYPYIALIAEGKVIELKICRFQCSIVSMPFLPFFITKGKISSQNMSYANSDFAYDIFGSYRMTYFVENVKNGNFVLSPNIDKREELMNLNEDQIVVFEYEFK